MPWRDPHTGETFSHAAAIARLARSRVVLLGERHDQAADHRFQELTIAGLAARWEDLGVGLEMFPVQLQPVLDAWSGRGMSEPEFLRETRWEEVWGFDPDLYLPLFRLCRDLGLPMIAMNVARPVVSLIGREGWRALPEEYRTWLTPAAAAGADYRQYLFDVTGGARPGREARNAMDPLFDRFVRAQQVWDRAFACALARICRSGPERRTIGIVGRGHVEYGLGMPAQLRDLGIDEIAVALPAIAGGERIAPKGSYAARRMADLEFSTPS